MKLKKTAARASTSTHFENETTAPATEEAGAMLNHQEAEMLIDPDDDTGGNTHTPVEASKKPAATTTAKKKQGKPVKAEFPPGSEGKFKKNAKDKEDESDEVEADVTGKGPNKDQDVGHLPNDEDPAAGYLTNASGEEEDEDEFEEDDEVNADFDSPAALEHGDNPQSVLEAGDDWDDGEGGGEENHKVGEGEVDEGEGGHEGAGGGEGGGDEFATDDAAFTNLTGDDATDVGDDDEDVDAAAGPSTADGSSTGDDMSLVDIDGMDDDGDDVVFANTGTRLIALKGTRAIAHISKKLAAKVGFSDEYLSDQFQDTVQVEMSKAGLRKGLTSMGFALARVNLAKSTTLNKRVEAKVKVVTAAVRRNSRVSTERMEQCMAIAAVGINRKFFKDTSNELRAALESELQAAGVRGANKLIQRAFAEHGVSYAKAIVTTANKLLAMPQTARDAMAESLDMTDESEMEDDDLFGSEEGPDFQAEFADTEESDESFDDEFDDEIGSPETVHAALLRPARKMQNVKANVRAGSMSVTAAAVLNGEAPLPFASF